MKYQQDYFNSTTVKSQTVFKRYMSFLQDVHITLNDKKILDIGCATGEFLELLPKGMDIYGIDIASYVIEKCKKLVPLGTFEVCDLNIQDLGSQATFDLITMFDVVEHLTNMEHLIKILHTNLNPGGYFVLTTPNANSLQRVIARSKSTGEHDMTHTMLFTPYTLDFFLRRIGLMKITLCTPYSFFFKNNTLTRTILFGGQIFTIYQKPAHANLSPDHMPE